MKNTVNNGVSYIEKNNSIDFKQHEKREYEEIVLPIFRNLRDLRAEMHAFVQNNGDFVRFIKRYKKEAKIKKGVDVVSKGGAVGDINGDSLEYYRVDRYNYDFWINLVVDLDKKAEVLAWWREIIPEEISNNYKKILTETAASMKKGKFLIYDRYVWLARVYADKAQCKFLGDDEKEQIAEEKLWTSINSFVPDSKGHVRFVSYFKNSVVQGISKYNKANAIKRKGQLTISLEDHLGSEGNGRVSKDTLRDNRLYGNTETLAENNSARRIIKEASEKISLNSRERVILQKRLLTNNVNTLQEIADIFNVSRERVRQLEAQLLSRMKEYIKKEYKIDKFDDIL